MGKKPYSKSSDAHTQLYAVGVVPKSIHARLERLVFEAEKPPNVYPKPYEPLTKATTQQLKACLQILYNEVCYLINEVQLCAFLQTL